MARPSRVNDPGMCSNFVRVRKKAVVRLRDVGSRIEAAMNGGPTLDREPLIEHRRFVRLRGVEEMIQRRFVVLDDVGGWFDRGGTLREERA